MDTLLGKPVDAMHDYLESAYNDGKRYAQYDATTDKAAAYGLAALVGGVAAKKLGLLAVAAAFFAKFFKLILVGLAVAGGALTRLFRRKA